MIGPEATGGEWAAGIFTVLGLLVLVAVVGEFTPDLWRWIKRAAKAMKGDDPNGLPLRADTSASRSQSGRHIARADGES